MDRPTTAADRAFAEYQRSGAPGALGDVYDRLAPELLRVAWHLTARAADAEDALQATFVAAIQGAERFDPARPVLPWLTGILANEARRLNARAARRADPERLRVPAAPDPEQDAERRELLERLESALERVPEAFRPVLRLRLRHGLTETEIAAVLERPCGTVRSQLARGTELLRRALPAGLAGGWVALVPPTRGLAAVRTSVLAEAARHAPVTLSMTLGGLLAVKKLVAVAALLVAAVSVWSIARPASVAPGVRGAAPLAPEARLVVPEDVEGPAPASPPQAPTRRAEPAAAPEGSERDPAVAAELASTAELLVRAAWPDGTPAAGEVVLVSDARASRPDEALARLTDPTGVARFPALEPGTVLVRLLRGAQTPLRLEAGETRELRLRVHAGVDVRGRVVDGDGRALAGASIWLSERYSINLGRVLATSDEEGGFRLRHVGPDQVIGARKRGFAPSGLRSVRGGAGDELAVELVLDEAGVAVTGRVLDEAGAPIAGAFVLLGDEHPAYTERQDDGSFAPAAPPQRARTDAAGRFEIECAAPGVHPIRARAAGFGPVEASVELVPAAPNDVTLTLLPEARVVGRVVEPAGLAAVWIRAGASGDFGTPAAWSDANGEFELRGVGSGPVTLLAGHAEHGEATIDLSLRPGETFEWDVVLRPTNTIAGRVVDERGAPLAGMTVVVSPGGDRTRRQRSQQSDREGRFALGGLEPERHELWVQPPGGWRGFPLLVQEDVWPGGPPMTLRVPDPGRTRGTIVATVRAEDGAAVGGAELQVWHEEARLWRSFPAEGPEARIRVETVPPGHVDLELRHPEHPWLRLGRREVRAGETLDLGQLVFPAAGRLRARVTGLDEPELERLRALLVDDTNHEGGVMTRTGAELRSGPLAPGRYVLQLSGDYLVMRQVELEIRPGVEELLDVALERGALREVVFPFPAGVPRPSWIACTLLGGSGVVWNGNADCTRTPPSVRLSAPVGSYRLMVGGEGGWKGEAEVEIERLDGADVPFVLSLERAP